MRGRDALGEPYEYLTIDRDSGTVAPALFETRAEARAFATARYGYIHNRPDLRAKPHRWMTAKVVRVTATYDWSGA